MLVSVYSPEYPPYGAGPPLPVGTGASPGASILAAFAFELSFLLPLLALMVTYWVYAGPRLRGTTESLLARPVTRRGLFLVRYGTIVLTLVVAVVAEVLLLEAEVVGILNEPLPPSFLEGMAGGLAVAALGMVGLAFLSAHAFRSSGAVLGVGLAVVLVTSVFWELIPAALRALFGNALAPEAYSALILRSELFAPSQIPILVVGDLTGAAFFGPSTSLAAVGITEGVIGAAAVLWVAVPILLTYWRVVTRD